MWRVNYIALFCPTTLAAQFTWAYLTYKVSMQKTMCLLDLMSVCKLKGNISTLFLESEEL